MSNEPIANLDSFCRSGSLRFGGEHVVLPLLQAEVVTPGWVTIDELIAGYGAAQAVPGPLFTFSAYLGTISDTSLTSWAGGFFALAAIFLPAFLLVGGSTIVLNDVGDARIASIFDAPPTNSWFTPLHRPGHRLALQGQVRR